MLAILFEEKKEKKCFVFPKNAKINASRKFPLQLERKLYCKLNYLFIDCCNRLLYCTETPSALVSPAFVEHTLSNTSQPTFLASPGQRIAFTNPCTTCTDTLTLSRQDVPSKDLIKDQRSERITYSQLTVKPLICKDDTIQTESTIIDVSKTEELLTKNENSSDSIVHCSLRNDTKSSIKPETVHTEQAVQTERSLTAAYPENSFNTKAIQTQHMCPINADKFTAHQATQTECIVISPTISARQATDQSTQTNQIISSSSVAVQVEAGLSVPNELNFESPIKITQNMGTIQAVLTEKTNSRTTEKSTQTEREPPLSGSSENMLQEQTQQLMEQISQLQNTCLHQSIIIQALSGTEATIPGNRRDIMKTFKDATLLDAELY